jgi:Mg-chelatase subunit ChlD
MEKSVKLKNNFYLTVKDLKVGQTTLQNLKSQPTNFIFVIDVSGSMYYDLDMIRKQLKNKLPNLIKVGDTVTFIWFSGHDQAGILKEEVEVRALTDLQTLNEAIDRYLQAICLTAFHKPLVLAKEAIQRMKKNRPDSVFSLIFLTDGYNNDCRWSDVMDSLKDLEDDLAASTFVEYGYYADTRRVTEMAQSIGGEKVDAAHFDDYDTVFEAKIQKSYSSSKRIVVDVPSSTQDFAFTVSDGEIILYSINDGKVTVPDNTKELCYFTSQGSTDPILNSGRNSNIDNSILYAALYVLSDKMQYDEADYVFQKLGDKYLYDLFVNAYGKQKLMSFKALVKECVTNEDKRFIDGYVDSLVVEENAYSIMNMIDDLTADDTAQFFPFHDDFNYKRIGAKRKQETGLTADEKKLILETDSLKEIKEIVDNAEGRDIKFEYGDKTKGYPLTDLVWSSSRANLSVRVRYEGYVELPKNKFGLDKVDTFIYRTYTLIKDGILNVSKLPIKASYPTINKFSNRGLVIDVDSNDIVTIDFNHLPVVNRKMVKNISAQALGEKEYHLFELKALEKVWKYYENKHFPRVSQGFVDLYGADAEVWLKEIGITQFNGFAPKTTAAEASDMYMAVELKTKIAKHSALPKVDVVIAKYLAGKSLNPAETLMAVAIKDYEETIHSHVYISLNDQTLKDNVLQTLLSSAKLNIRKERRSLLQEIAQIKFALILSKKWFEEFDSFDENKLTMTMNGSGDVHFTFDMVEKEIAV